MYTRSFERISRADVSAVGGKGAFLGELTRHGVPVPPGFVVLTDAFVRYLSGCGLSDRIRDDLLALREARASVDAVSEELSSRIVRGAIPGDIATEILEKHAALFGLGEPIVGGQLTPDHYRVSRESLSVVESFLSPQERGVFLLDDGSTGWKSLDAETVSRQKLDDREIGALAALVVSVERIAGFPCDVEWVYEQGRFAIVQCRPITTLG